MKIPNKLPSINPKDMPYLTDELNDIQEFVKGCYEDGIILPSVIWEGATKLRIPTRHIWYGKALFFDNFWN